MKKIVMDSRIFGRNEVKELGDSVDFVKRKLLNWCNRVVEFYDVNKDIRGWYKADEIISSSIEIPKGSKIMNHIVYIKERENKIMSFIYANLFKLYCLFKGYRHISS